MDQLDMQCEMARREITRSFDALKVHVATWEPARGITFRINIPNDQDRIYGDEVGKWRQDQRSSS